MEPQFSKSFEKGDLHELRKVEAIGQKLTEIGPITLKTGINDIIKTIDINKWKNIPLPLHQSSKALFSCVNLLERFSLFLDHRFNNLTTAANQQWGNIGDDISKVGDRTEQVQKEMIDLMSVRISKAE